MSNRIIQINDEIIHTELKDTIGLKVEKDVAFLTVYKIVKSYKQYSISELKKIIEDGGAVLRVDYTDSKGVKTIIDCYYDMLKSGVLPQLYELDDEPTTIEFLENLNRTYAEISNEIDLEDDQ